ncbi:MAG TPA: thiamine pyrophosphate-dependent enzyme [Candidatus Goldiibacteriota bacterium]|nr:thiamine pyrophosphate-dependent enzyme [Candidatus Goldiibacteriota bacterium]HPN64605.1 thiamine pyrophosphate-dependent enzyme [Candidatus Goldiibacteriota bacterium]HRQ44857.1 thiamine pyrophosphate-dependent enzyme [Candidatus Goldiibacteriota bacterium]
MGNIYAKENVEIAWCPGCGNFGIRNTVLKALEELSIPRENLVFVSGIGQSAKAPQYYNTSYFNGLHGRALPAAAAIKGANPQLKVIVESGDGDMYGEGGNHFIHAIRRNSDITVIVHNNMVYGLTKGQASPTSRPGFTTPVQVDGVFENPLNPAALAIALDASFVARASAGEQEKTKEIIKSAVNHKGFALVDIFSACVSFNKVNTHKWFKENTYIMEEGYDPKNRAEAFKKSLEEGPWPLGILYINENKPVFEEKLAPYLNKDNTPLYLRKREISAVKDILDTKK